ncbi:Transcriptional regulatory protein YycF [Slackia heliotrinireducens]|uniref:c-type heme family protein n=1 Tax=Slackia heliotrinireducens TaxID=84110 RepID=UPI000F71F2F1|nr:DUF3365 domain-containing protein [Slackia heliotrinireducens]VEH03644.1 Transcriptional regulatory protein YycF [Slackia heliotrinireducens]
MATPIRTKPLGIQGKLLLCLAALLVAFSVVGIIGGAVRSHDQSIEAASQKASALADQMDAVWDYIETHQGVVAETDEAATSANGYVCIISAKSVAARFSDMSESTIRYTSLQPRNTDDAPDDFERAAMELFEQDPTVVAYENVDNSTGTDQYRYLRPIRIEQSCLTCHGSPKGELDWLGYTKEGYAVGDLVGAISISEPMDTYYQASWREVGDWLALLLVGLAIATIVMFSVVDVVVLRPVSALSEAMHAFTNGETAHRVDEPRGNDEVAQLGRDFNGMADELEDLYSGLEQRVEQRTAELEGLNATLSDMLTNQQQNLELAVERLREEREAMARRSLEPLNLGEFVFDQAKYTVTKRGESISLTPKEFSILYTLACRAGEVVTQRELVEAAWGEDYTEQMAGLAVYVRRIRKKIEDNPAEPQFLLTVWGEGYTFKTGD